MPRKKKRSTLHRKPSLIFIESPVHVQNNVPSPVFCARHPPTANTVQVEELRHLPWVSPQFRPGSSVQAKTRGGRRRRKSIACLRNAEKENTCHGHNDFRKDINYKFQSLKFLGDPSINASEAEDIEFTIDSATEDEKCAEDEMPVGDLDPSNKVTRRNVKNVNHPDSKEPAGNFFKVRKKIKLGDKTRGLGKLPENTSICNNYELSSDKSDNEALNESSKIVFTQVRRRSMSVPPVKRLFSTQLGQPNKFDIDGAIHTDDETQANKVLTIETIAEAETDSDNEAVSETEPECFSESDSGMDTPTFRRSLRIQILKSLLQGTPAIRKPEVILAPDTPEEEYGWSLRKKQLRSYRR